MPFRIKTSRYWHYDFRVGGRRFSGSCRTENFQEAKAVEAEERVKAKQAIARGFQAVYTIGEALGTYWSDVCQHQTSASTAKSQATAILKVIPKATRLPDLTNAQLAKAAAKMRATVADSTVNRRMEMLARSIRYMARVHDADIPKLDFGAVRLRERKERIRELSADEERRLFKTLRSDLQPFVKFALMTGKRRAEICGLKWSDIDYDANRIHFRVKGGKIHSLPMNADIRALLSAVRRSNIMAARRYVFTYRGQDGELRPIPQSGGHVWKLWREALTEAEIEDLRFHDLRHTFATRLLRQCRNLKLVSRLLGHASIETTMRYAHVLDDDLEAGMEAFSALSPEKITELSGKPLKHKG